MENTLNLLSRRAGFNTALRHFKSTNAFVQDISSGDNLADAVNDAIADGVIARYQVRAILNALLVDKFGYVYQAHNLEQTVESADKVVERVENWGNLHLVVAYHHPQAGLFLINPKNSAHWEEALPLVEDELIVVYAGGIDQTMEEKTLHSGINDFLKILYGRNVKDKEAYVGPGKRGVRQPQPSQEPSPAQEQTEATEGVAPSEEAPARAGKRRITPKYSVVVTNELFHNGNVEAWKKIIESYQAKYPDLDVLIWYENERINDINALFKWGKVKHGVPIMFSVSGENIKDVRKLQRYLYEGASPRFEAFLGGGVDRVLDLF